MIEGVGVKGQPRSKAAEHRLWLQEYEWRSDCAADGRTDKPRLRGVSGIRIRGGDDTHHQAAADHRRQ